MEEKKELLRIEHLTVSFAQYEKRSAKQGELPVIRDLNVTVREGEIVAVVGSSGSGKSLLAHAIMGILPANAAASGSIFYRGSACGEAELKALRGREIALVPQSVNYLDPLMKVGRQIIGETKKRQKLFGEADQGKRQKLFCGADREKRQAEAQMRELLARYGLADEVADLYPFELSGGMARRVLLRWRTGSLCFMPGRPWRKRRWRILRTRRCCGTHIRERCMRRCRGAGLRHCPEHSLT